MAPAAGPQSVRQPPWPRHRHRRGRRDFPLLARAYLEGSLLLDDLISRRIGLDEINDGFAALKRGETIRSVVMFD